MSLIVECLDHLVHLEIVVHIVIVLLLRFFRLLDRVLLLMYGPADFSYQSPIRGSRVIRQREILGLLGGAQHHKDVAREAGLIDLNGRHCVLESLWGLVILT